MMMPDDLYEMRAEQARVTRRLNQLRRHRLRHPDPRDPDAMSDEERDELADLENWEP